MNFIILLHWFPDSPKQINLLEEIGTNEKKKKNKHG